MNYIDAFVLAVPSSKREAYVSLSQLSAAIFKEFGALRVVECWGENVPQGKLTSFPMAVKCEPDETVVFSWIEWPSKQAREEGMKKFMADSRLSKFEMPFDGKRMIFGGFEPIVEV